MKQSVILCSVLVTKLKELIDGLNCGGGTRCKRNVLKGHNIFV